MASLFNVSISLVGSIYTKSYEVWTSNHATLLADHTGDNALSIDLSLLRTGAQVIADDSEADAIYYDYLINGDANLPGVLLSAEFVLNGYDQL